jgi:diamine N-acetyltransferase
VPEGLVAEGPVVNIVGKQVALGPLRRELLPLYHRWLNDLAVARMLDVVPRPVTLDQEQAWFERASREDPTTTRFTIYERTTWRPVGDTDFFDINWRDRTAEFGILIGEADARGKGYGTETATLMLDYAFTALGLHSVFLRVYEYNVGAQRAYAKAGYRESGRRRQCHSMGGRLWDMISMDCLASEFVSPVLAPLFLPDQPRTLPQ